MEMSKNIEQTGYDAEEIDKVKREFMKKFGQYAATAPIGMYLLMGPGSSKAQASGSVAPLKCVKHRGHANYTVEVRSGGKLKIDAYHYVHNRKRPVHKVYEIHSDGNIRMYKNGRRKKMPTLSHVETTKKPGLLYKILEQIGFWG